MLLVDTGKSSSFETLVKNFESLHISVGDISYLILTHTHFDHCQSARRIKEESGCKVVVSSLAADSIKTGYAGLPGGTFVVTKLIAGLGRLIGKRKFGFEPFQPDILIDKEYDLCVAGSSIKLIETAGHSADSVSILVDNEVALVGDVMFGVFKNSVFPPYADDIAKMTDSWGKLLQTDCKIFLPGHGKEIKRTLLQKEYEKYT
jgi:glyoxylase-like metal-dependent hydrolase (beta-lactamase superfamily II)